MMEEDRMLAAVLKGQNDLKLEQRDIPQVGEDAILVRVESCCICGSDLRILKHGNARVPADRVIGHELSGTVVDLGGDVSGYQIGDRVSIGADIPCGKCPFCLGGAANNCETNLAIGYQYDGGYAEYILLDHLMLSYGPIQKFSADLDFDEAAMAEPLACCINGYEKCHVDSRKIDSAVVFGAGPIGLMLGLLARSNYDVPQVIFVEPSEKRRETAFQLGFKSSIDPRADDPVEAIMALTGGKGADVLFTACPAVETHAQAICAAARGGVVNFFGGLPAGSPEVSICTNDLHYKEITLTGSHGSTPLQHKAALEMISSGRFPAVDLLSDSFPLSRIEEAIECASSGTGIKVVVKPHQEAAQES